MGTPAMSIALGRKPSVGAIRRLSRPMLDLLNERGGRIGRVELTPEFGGLGPQRPTVLLIRRKESRGHDAVTSVA